MQGLLQPRRFSFVAAAVATLVLMCADRALATQAANAGQPVGSTSATLMKKPYNSLTSSQKSKVIADPPAPPVLGSTSIFYDRANYNDHGFVRANFDGIQPGPGYVVAGGLVELQQQSFDKGASAVEPDGGCCADILYQDVNDFLNFGPPSGFFETGYLKVSFQLVDPGAAGPQDLSGFEDEGYQVVATDGVNPAMQFDTYILDFDIPLADPEDDPLIFYEHFANPDAPGGADHFLVKQENGDGLIPIPAENITRSIVPVPEPAAAALALAVGLGAFGFRARRRI